LVVTLYFPQKEHRGLWCMNVAGPGSSPINPLYSYTQYLIPLYTKPYTLILNTLIQKYCSSFLILLTRQKLWSCIQPKFEDSYRPSWSWANLDINELVNSLTVIFHFFRRQRIFINPKNNVNQNFPLQVFSPVNKLSKTL
jgi:hypothetical protein